MDSRATVRLLEDAMFLRVREVARRLAVSRGTVYNLIRSGELLSIKVRGSRRIPADALQTYVEARMEGAVAEVEERLAEAADQS